MLRKNQAITVGIGAVLAGAVILTQTAASNQGQATHQLGGAYIGTGGGMTWTALHIPLDPAGRTAAVRINDLSYGEDFAGLIAMFGANAGTEAVGHAQMISRDTAKAGFVGYFVQQGNPPRICAIYTWTGTFTFTGTDTAVVKGPINVYPGPANILGLATADANGDGYPDPGVSPMFSFPYEGNVKQALFP